MSDTYNTKPDWVRLKKNSVEHHNHCNGICDLDIDSGTQLLSGYFNGYFCCRVLDSEYVKSFYRAPHSTINGIAKAEARSARTSERMSLRNITKAWNMSMIDEDDDQMFVEPYKASWKCNLERLVGDPPSIRYTDTGYFITNY